MAKLKSHMLAHVTKNNSSQASSSQINDTLVGASVPQFPDFPSEQNCSPGLMKGTPITFTAAISSRSSKAKMQVEAERAANSLVYNSLFFTILSMLIFS